MNKIFLWILLVFIGCLQVEAIGNDSLEGKKEFYHYYDDPHNTHQIDTGLQDIEEYNFVQKNGFEYYNLGNLGLAHIPLVYQSPNHIEFRNGMDQFDLYILRRDSIKYYQVLRPFVEISYLIGLSNESFFEGKHSQRLTKTFDYGVHFHRISSKGQFANQTTLNNAFTLYTRYISPNKKYDLTGNLIYNRVEAKENGGVTTDIYDTSATFFSSSIIDVEVGDSKNDYRNVEYGITNGWNIGYHLLKQINDTTEVREFVPQFRMEYDLSIGKTKNYFFDADPDAEFYNLFYTDEDSLEHLLRYTDIEQSVTFKTLGNYKKGEGARFLNNLTSASLVHNNFELKQRGLEKTFNNTRVEFTTESNSQAKSKLGYRFSGQYTFTGYNQGDFQLTAKVSYNFNKYGKLILNARQLNNEIPWIAHRYESFDLEWNNDFNKTRTFEFNAGYLLKDHHLSINARYLRVDNQIYWDTAAIPNQLQTGINGIIISLKKDFHIKNLHWTNLVVFQSYNNEEDVIRLPTYWSKHSLYYEGRLFNGVLRASLGFDVRYNNNYYANRYNAVTGQFFIQDNLEMKYYPVMDVFLNAKISTVRISLKVNNVNQGLFKRGYYAAYLYPTDLRSFMVGINWRFFD